MSAILTDFHASVFPVPPVQPDAGLDDLLKLRTALVLEHPLNQAVERATGKLFLMFELYADFVFDFTEYVCRLFMALRDEDMKSVIYENLIDELGLGSAKPSSWKTQHGELYRQFIHSLRLIESYRAMGIGQRIVTIERASKAISRRFYDAHAAIIADGDDRQSFAAFSTIECWVCDLYAFWRRSLKGMGCSYESLDMRTIDLHCICDAEHSTARDSPLRRKLSQSADALHRVRKGVVRGMVASEQLFSDIHRKLA